MRVAVGKMRIKLQADSACIWNPGNGWNGSCLSQHNYQSCCHMLGKIPLAVWHFGSLVREAKMRSHRSFKNRVEAQCSIWQPQAMEGETAEQSFSWDERKIQVVVPFACLTSLSLGPKLTPVLKKRNVSRPEWAEVHCQPSTLGSSKPYNPGRSDSQQQETGAHPGSTPAIGPASAANTQKPLKEPGLQFQTQKTLKLSSMIWQHPNWLLNKMLKYWSWIFSPGTVCPASFWTWYTCYLRVHLTKHSIYPPQCLEEACSRLHLLGEPTSPSTAMEHRSEFMPS